MLKFTNYVLEDGFEMSSNFAWEVLKKHVIDRISCRYRREPLVGVCYLDNFEVHEITLEPGKPVLPTYYKVREKNTKKQVNINRGCHTTIDLLFSLQYSYDERMANLIIATCINDYVLPLMDPNEGREYFKGIKNCAIYELKEEYEVWDSDAKKFLPIRNYDEVLNEEILRDIDKLAQYLIDAFESMFIEYQIFRVCHTQESFESAKRIGTKVVRELEKEIKECIYKYKMPKLENKVS